MYHQLVVLKQCLLKQQPTHSKSCGATAGICTSACLPGFATAMQIPCEHHRMQVGLRLQQVGALATQSRMMQLLGSRKLQHRGLTKIRTSTAQQRDDQAGTVQQVGILNARSQVWSLADCYDRKSVLSIAFQVSCGLQGALLAHLQGDAASLSLSELMQHAAVVRDQGHQFISFSPKVMPVSAS